MTKTTLLTLFLLGSSLALADNDRKGLVICLGEDALTGISDKWNADGFLIQGLETSDEAVAALRQKIKDAGCYGKVSVVRYDGKTLPYVDNLASHVIAGAQCHVPRDEILRVLAPYGTADLNGTLITQPFPPEMDEWPQYLHGSDNNCVSSDTRVGPPRHVQWISGPAWTRAHEGAASVPCMVSAGGRLFSIVDTAAAEAALLPAKWKLIARNAFNGIQLWSRDYPDWEPITVYVKTFHTQSQRQLIAAADTLYCKPGRKALVTTLNPATGEILRDYPGTERTTEMVLHDGVLYLVVGDRMYFNEDRGYRETPSGDKKRSKKKKGASDDAKQTDPEKPQPNTKGTTFQGNGFPYRYYNRAIKNVPEPTCRIVAINPASGEELWRSDDIKFYTACTLCFKKNKLVYQSTQGVFCLDAKTGKRNWAVEKKIPYGMAENPHTVVLSDEAVYSEEGNNLFAYSLANGSAYWESPLPFKLRKGYEASSDILIAKGALWVCGWQNQTPTSYNLKTGEKIKTLPQVLSAPMGHDRCFRNYITDRFYINSKTGGPDCLDLESGTEYPAPFTRATCTFGPLPCNGLLYCGPYSCQCHLSAALHNFNVYTTNEESLKQPGVPVKIEREDRLLKGPAHGHQDPSQDAPWPTYRQDHRRYSGMKEPMSDGGLTQAWRARLKAPITAPVLAQGMLFLAETDSHTLWALDAATGTPRWEYVAGARIDAPPTYYKGLVLFGSRDGWVHCLRASDGALSWRFRDLPDRLVCVYEQLESAWPVHGSILILNNTAYFCAGRSSHLDGGLFIYGLDPVTGETRHRRQFFGPYKNGMPAFEEGKKADGDVLKGTTADVMSSEDGKLYIRQHAFTPDLKDTEPGVHLHASAGFLESRRQHREYVHVRERFNNRKYWTTGQEEHPNGDIIVADGERFFTVFSTPVTRQYQFNPIRDGYHIIARTKTGDGWSMQWKTRLAMTGKSMALGGDVIFVAGSPLGTSYEEILGTYEERRGGLLWAVSAKDGSKLGEFPLNAPPRWDSMALGYGSLFLSLQDGSILRLNPK